MIVSSETENQPAAALYAVAAELLFAARLRLLALLETGECNVSQIAGALGEEMSTVSQRLKLLRFHGLVARRRQGKHIYYSLADAHVAGLIRSGLQHAAEGAAHG
jgi:DNA-binding transcriptional ArsR family regulator